MRGLLTLFFVFVFSFGSVTFSQSSKSFDSIIQNATYLKSDKVITLNIEGDYGLTSPGQISSGTGTIQFEGLNLNPGYTDYSSGIVFALNGGIYK